MQFNWKEEMFNILYSQCESNLSFNKRSKALISKDLFIDEIQEPIDIYSEFTYLGNWVITLKPQKSDKKDFTISKPPFKIYNESEITIKINELFEELINPFIKKLEKQKKGQEYSILITDKDYSKKEPEKLITIKPATITSATREIINIAETLILVCRLTQDRYLDVRKKVEDKRMDSFGEDFREFSKSIFGYWKGSPFKIPDELKRKLKESEGLTLETNTNLYYLLRFENVNIPKDLFDKAPSVREKALKKLALEKNNFEYSVLFSELPNSCTIL